MLRLVLCLLIVFMTACSLSRPEEETLPAQETPALTLSPQNETPAVTLPPTRTPFGQVIAATPQQAAAQNATAAPTVALRVPVPATVPAAPARPSAAIDPAVRAFALSASGGVQRAEIALPGEAVFVAFNPADASRAARVDSFGMLHFAPLGGGEGVYSFAPYFEGFSTASAQDNKLLVAEVGWSPNGQMLAFRIASGAPEANDGIWFWQPAREFGTDPSYHLLRDCPPGCMMVERINADEWRSLSFDWSGDNQSILVTLDLPTEKRRGLAVVYAVRDQETRQSRTGPNVLRYDYGHWTADGQRIVVSGAGPDGRVVFGTMGRDGGNTALTPASSIGLAWVQDAVQQPGSGQIVMLGSTSGVNGEFRIYDSAGKALTDAIGNGQPARVSWSPDRSAVLVVYGAGNSARYLVARVNGGVIDITAEVAATKAVNWVSGALPASARLMQPAVPSGVVEGSPYRPAQQLRVAADQLTVYAEPSISAKVLGTLARGDYVAILAGPAENGTATLWQVQTAGGLVGWVASQISGVTTLSP